MSAPVVNGRKLAHVRDAPNQRDRIATAGLLARALAAPPPPYRVDPLLDLMPFVLDQGALGSCTVNAAAGAVYAAMSFAGVRGHEILSRLAAYWIARKYDADTANDDGAQIRNVFAGIMKYGFAPESLWPYSDDARPNAPFSIEPPAEVLREMFDRRVGGSYEKIDETGAARTLAVKNALAARHLVVFGTAVSNDYCHDDFDAEAPLDPPAPDQVAGLHAQCLFGYTGDVFDVLNSWGPSWGNGGRARYSRKYVEASATSDLWIVRLAPNFDEATT